MESHHKSVLVAVIGILAFGYGGFATMQYRAWVKESTVEAFEACMVFERDRLGEAHCLAYARSNDNYSPFPLSHLLPWQPLLN